MVAIGSYTSDDWLVTIGTGEFTLQGFDYMETLRTMQFPYVPLINDPDYLNLSDYITYVVLAAGFDCDLTIYRTITLLLAYSTSEYIKEWLQKITEAIIGVAYINRLNTLQVRELPFDDNVSRNQVKQIWLDSDIIINVSNPQKFSNTYSSLIVSIPVVSPLSTLNVAYIKELVFTSTITISNIKFSQPIYYIESIEIRGSSSVMIDDVKYNSFSCELTLSSSSLEQQTVEIIVNACVMITIKNDKTFTNPVTINNYTLEKVIDTPYIQSLEMATAYTEEYFLALGDPSSNFEVETYWNPAVELCDRITINSQIGGVLVDIAITKQTWTWDGTLSANVEGRKLFNRG
jgi:hypothetical protein